METAIFELCGERELNPRRTFDCGQCFRWNEDETGRWRGVASGKAAVVWAEEGRTYIECALEDIYFWRDYLDMDTDYDDARRSIEVCDYLRDCAAYGEGIRILRQDKWEALCSFIISQCNNIPRIKGIVEKLCSLYGDAVEAPWGEARSFPSAERVAELDEAVYMFTDRARTEHKNLIYDEEDTMLSPILGDVNRLRQVFINIVVNAI